MNNFIESFKPKWNSFKESMYLLARNKLSLLAFAIIILLVLSAIFAPVIVPYPEDVYSTHIEQKLEAPSSEHIMGTDELGRDVFSRLVYGARVSISTALIAVGVALVIGIPMGAIAGTFGGWVDQCDHADYRRVSVLSAAAAGHRAGDAAGTGPDQRHHRHRGLLVALVHPFGAGTGHQHQGAQVRPGGGDHRHQQGQDHLRHSCPTASAR